MTGIWSHTYHVALPSDTTWPRQKSRYCAQLIPNQNSSAQIRQLRIAFADQIDALAQAVANSGEIKKNEMALFDLLPLYFSNKVKVEEIKDHSFHFWGKLTRPSYEPPPMKISRS